MLPWAEALAQTHPTRQSLASFSRDPAKVASLRKGVAAMKARAPSDPKSWFFQAAIHAYNDAAYNDALARDPGWPASMRSASGTNVRISARARRTS